MQLTMILNRAPIRLLGMEQDPGCVLDLGHVWFHGVDDGIDLRRIDAPHAQEAEFLACARGVAKYAVGIAQVERHVMRRHNAVCQCCRDDLGLRAHQQVVPKLPGAAHGRRRNGAMMARDKIHQAEIEHLDPGQGRDVMYVTQRTMGFDQDMDRDFAADFFLLRDRLDVSDHFRHLHDVGGFGDGDVGQHLARSPDQNVDVFFPVLMGVVVDACSRHEVLVGGRGQHLHDHLGVFPFLAGRCAVLAVAGDVKDRSQLVLQFESFKDELFASGEVFARRNHRERFFAFEQCIVGVNGGHGLSPGIKILRMHTRTPYGAASEPCSRGPEPGWPGCFQTAGQTRWPEDLSDPAA